MCTYEIYWIDDRLFIFGNILDYAFHICQLFTCPVFCSRENKVPVGHQLAGDEGQHLRLGPVLAQIQSVDGGG